MKKINFNIQKQLSLLGENQNKSYLTKYKIDGYEIGFGKKGRYLGHSHFHFYDVMFSPEGIKTKSITGKAISNNLIVIQPKTYMDNVTLGDFFFIKFCPSAEKVNLPDKTNLKLNEGKIFSYDSVEKLNFTWYKSPTKKNKINLSLVDSKLIICINPTLVITVE